MPARAAGWRGRLPRRLRARWRDLPALAALTTTRFANSIIGRRWIGRLAWAGAVFLDLIVLTAAHVSGRLAARGRHATVWVRPYEPPGRRWRRHVIEVLMGALGMGVVLVVYTLVVAGSAVLLGRQAVYLAVGLLLVLATTFVLGWFALRRHCSARRVSSTAAEHAIGG